MAVLVEAISMILKRSVIEEKFPGGWDGFVRDAPNQSLCADREIARVGFMSPVDVQSYCRYLEGFGFRYVENGAAVDLIVVDQQRGPAGRCDWIEFGHVCLDGDPRKKVAACRAVGSVSQDIAMPDGWKFEGSLSQTFTFVPTEHLEKSLKFLRHEGGVDVYLNTMTGEIVRSGRTGERMRKPFRESSTDED